MAFDISLTSGMRADLTSLQGTAQLLNRTQQRLSSGKSVNSAVDDPAAYFASQDHINHASDLSSRKADMGEAIQAVNAANAGITNITTLINQAKGLVTSAQSANTTTRASLAGQFNTLRTQIDQLASDSGYNGKNFLENDQLNVLFNETGSSTLLVQGFKGDSLGLGITTAALAVGTTYNTAPAVVGSDVTNTTYTLAHSGLVSTANVVLTQTVTTLATASMVAGNASASALNNKSVTLGHAGTASSITVYAQIVAVSGLVLSTGHASAGATSATSSTGSVVLGATMSAMPTNFNVYTSGGALTLHTNFTATYDAGTQQVTIKLRTGFSTSHAVSVSYSFNRTLTAGAGGSYTVTNGGLTTAAQINFKADQASATTISVNYTYHAQVDASKYTLNVASATAKGSITVANGTTITGAATVTYAVNKSAWADNTALNTDIDNLNTAINTLRTKASTMAANLSVITTRQSWSQSMINNLQTGSDNLTLADMNEEGANMLALQTRQQLGIQALSLASQSNQSIMRLFG